MNYFDPASDNGGGVLIFDFSLVAKIEITKPLIKPKSLPL